MSNLPPTPLGTSKNYLIAMGVALLLGGFEYLGIWRHEERAKALAAAAAASAAAKPAPAASTSTAPAH
ncbi:hypothetical protein C8J30_104163 [Rhodobacter viridis]|uniref:Uncharacterized protein n=1 Tax=Rhodobacter viridis TaxID=1054202 RepID=A0A318TZM1_9RHOB|nr:hypothetical protein [Rhodobacter viridis]PYF10684.1 hypothetical protein C8J30_104163 [Rhodobacter viridis]